MEKDCPRRSYDNTQEFSDQIQKKGRCLLLFFLFERGQVLSNNKLSFGTKLQVIRMLVTVLVVFIICWTPQQILVFYSAIYPEEYNQVQFTIIKLVARILLNKNVCELESQYTLLTPENGGPRAILIFGSALCTMWFLVVPNILIQP